VGVAFEVNMLRADGERNVDTPLETVVQHIDYLAERMGIDRVGLGSDFDGASMPQALRDVSKLPDLIAALRKRGYDDQAVWQVTHENWMRVLPQTWHD
jgi:membrane dipeptidase